MLLVLLFSICVQWVVSASNKGPVIFTSPASIVIQILSRRSAENGSSRILNTKLSILWLKWCWKKMSISEMILWLWQSRIRPKESIKEPTLTTTNPKINLVKKQLMLIKKLRKCWGLKEKQKCNEDNKNYTED